jgi:hypothetical protein
MANLTYGTAEFYKEQFLDILADVDADYSQYEEAIVQGFIAAVNDWRDYHAKQVVAYEGVKQRVRQALAV